MENHLITIPQELQIQILSNLDAVSLTCCAMSCKSIYETLKSSSLLTYIIQLHLDGLKDASTSSSHSELIASLVRRRQSWLSFKWAGCTIYSMQHACQTYEFAGGVFASTDRHSFELLRLPTYRDVKDGTFRRRLTGISVRDFTMDPTQDVMVLFEDDGTLPSLTDARNCHIHIRTISTNTVHPLALQSVLNFTIFPDLNSYNDVSSIYQEIAHNILVVVLNLETTFQRMRVLMWDWTTSDLRLDSSIAFDPFLPSPRRVFGFGLLDSMFCYATSSSNSGSIRLYKLVQSSAITAPLIHLVTLHLPPTTFNTTIYRIYNYAGPIEAQPLSYTPFMMNDDDRLHIFTVLYSPPRFQSGDLNIFVHQRVFKKYISRQLTAPNDQPLDVPWEEWGPSNTRAVHPRCIDPRGWSRYVHGQRVVFPRHIDDLGDYNDPDGQIEELTNSIEVLDFSLAAVLSAKGVLPMPSSHTSFQGFEPGTLVPSSTIQLSVFEDEVETHLPCVSFKRDLDHRCAGFMIHADGIVGVNVRPVSFTPSIYSEKTVGCLLELEGPDYYAVLCSSHCRVKNTIWMAIDNCFADAK